MVVTRFEIAQKETCVLSRSLIPLTASFLSNSGFRPQLLSIHTLSKSASANSFESHTSKKSRKCIKTNAFNPCRMHTYSNPSRNSFGITHFQKTGGGRGVRAIGARLDDTECIARQQRAPGRGSGLQIPGPDSKCLVLQQPRLATSAPLPLFDFRLWTSPDPRCGKLFSESCVLFFVQWGVSPAGVSR
jgi:hypothetical protein